MIGFRVDANEQVATGHLMRCISIAEMCRKKGEKVLFFLAEEKETERLNDRNIPFFILHTDYRDMEAEISVLKEQLRKMDLNCLVVDSYLVTSRYLREMESVVPVLYIDDMGRERYPVSAVLHYGIGTDCAEYKEKYAAGKTKVFTGMKYIPLREEFMNSTAVEQRQDRILITTGGTDRYNVAGKLLKACLSYTGEDGFFFKKCEYDVIAGTLNEHLPELEEIAKEEPRVHIHYNVSNMSEHMRTCKMAVSAGGTTLYELCACGIPAVCFSFSDDQEPVTVLFGQQELMDYAGDARKQDVIENVMKALLRLERAKEIYVDRQKRMREAVDGMGALRIAECLTGGF